MEQNERVADDLVTVWIVEDSTDYRETVCKLLDTEPDLACPRGFDSAEALLEFLNLHFAPELILMDIGLPGMSGIDATRRVRAISPATHVVMLTIHEDNDEIFEALCAGASGYLLKKASAEEIVSSVREVLGGGAPMTPQIARRVLNLFTQLNTPQWDYQLTEREKDVLRELVSGMSKKEIAKKLFLSVHTVDTHCRNIYAKLHVNSRSGAVAKAVKERLVRGVE